MNRRRLIVGGLGLAGVAALGVWGFGRLGFEAEIASILRRRLGFLDLDRDGVQRFAKDQATATFGKKIPTWNRLRYHFLSAVAPSFKRYYRSTDKRSRLARLEDSLVSTYLLSSDFFLNGADESRKINYVAYYDPMRPCQNPFARPAVDARTNT
jgi:hypothetical protein